MFSSYDPTVVDPKTFPAPEDAEPALAETEGPEEGEANHVRSGASEEHRRAS